MDYPFKITVYDKSLARLGFISTPTQLRVIPRHNLKGTATFDLGLNHPALADLMAAGSRVVIHYRGKQVLSGPVTARSINGPSISGFATFAVEDDFRVLHDILGWPVPTSAITDQSDAEFDIVTGPAETVLKSLIQRNGIDRLGMNLTLAPDLGRGDVITVELRMQSLYDQLFPAVEKAGLGVTVKQGTSSLVVDVYEPTIYEQPLTEESGVVQDWSWTNNIPKATNVVVGGRAEGAEREFRAVQDDTAAALWGTRAEVFADARNDTGSALSKWYGEMKTAQGQTPPDTAKIDELNGTYAGIRAEYETALIARGTEALQENAEKTGIRMVLSETDSFRYGDAVSVGDLVSMAVGPGLLLTDILREAELAWTTAKGVTATPSVGDITDNPDRAFAKALRNSVTRIRKIEVK